jgi:myosin-1
LTKGTTGRQKENLGISEPSDFNYLACSGEYNADGVDDVQEFGDMLRAMEICQISAQERDALLRIVAGILHLGNIEFIEIDGKTALRSKQSLIFPAYLLVSTSTNLEYI